MVITNHGHKLRAEYGPASPGDPDRASTVAASSDSTLHRYRGIAVGLALMFGAALRRYRRSALRKRDIRWLDEHHILDRLRKQLELSPRR